MIPGPAGVYSFERAYLKPFYQYITSVPVLQAVQSDIGITLDTGVSNWTDLSGNGKDYTQPTAGNQPSYGTTTVNGFSALTFDGVAQSLYCTNISIPAPGTTPTYMWFIFRTLTWSNTKRILCCHTNASVLTLFFFSSSPQIALFNGLGGGLAEINGGAAVNTWVRGETYWSNSTSDMLKLGSSAVTGTNAGNSNPAALGFEIGASNGNYYSNIEVLALMILGGKPTDAERNALDKAVYQKYGGLVKVV